MSANSLDLFDNLTKQWFSNNLGAPTAVQEEAWPAIAAGEHTLVSAPTGERVIIVTGCINALRSRVLGTLVNMIHALLRVIRV